jgi:MoaA/NifB/PqqE/SkfB family radical SAM enzyme
MSMDFPQSISLTITNACNLRCRMCGQWSEEGYIRCQPERLKHELRLEDWKRVIDELAEHAIPSLLLRGGEPFVFPGIIELIEYIHDKGIAISIDTNGTRLKDFAGDIARIGNIHLTISLDGPEAVHDFVRGMPGTYARVREGLQALAQAEARYGHAIGKSFNYTISRYSLPGLADLPAAARSMGVNTLAIVPYYYFPAAVGKEYERVLSEELDCPAFSWVGFHHEESGVDIDLFQREHRQYLASLDGLVDFPYLALSEEEYRTWFTDATTPVKSTGCTNVEKLIDIQPDGEANFCVDFVDYSMGNVRESSISAVWNSERAERFRAYRRKQPLPVCHRCGAKFMSEM